MNYFLYHLNEFSRAAAMPTHIWSKMGKNFYKSLGGKLEQIPYYSRFLMATDELLERSTRVFNKPTFDIKKVMRGKVSLGVKEETKITKTFCVLKHFSRHQDGKRFKNDDPKVLIVAPLAGHYATLLRDTVKAMAPWHDVYITDWLNARDIPLNAGHFSLETYIDYLLEFMKFLGPEHHVMAVCQPTNTVLASVAIAAANNEPFQPKSMILMGGPIDTRINPGEVNTFAKKHSLKWFKDSLITAVPAYYPGAGRQVCPGFIMLTGFMSLNPERHQEAAEKLFEHLIEGDQEGVKAHNRFYDEYRAVMDLDAPYFIDSVEFFFQKHLLAREKFEWRGQKVCPRLITKTALMTVEGERDDISPPGQTYAAQALCTGIPDTRKYHHFQEGVGHYGIFNGRRWRSFIQPAVARFIRAHV